MRYSLCSNYPVTFNNKHGTTTGLMRETTPVTRQHRPPTQHHQSSLLTATQAANLQMFGEESYDNMRE